MVLFILIILFNYEMWNIYICKFVVHIIL